MLVIAGTVPDLDFPLVTGPACLEGDSLKVEGHLIPVLRGTPALVAAAIKTAEVAGNQPPHVILAGDTGRGSGSRLVYQHIVENARSFAETTLTFHYLQPDVDWHNRILMALDALSLPPVRIADAGFMYAAKMSGYAASYDLFTPDVGELAFLADEKAPHPFYTRGFILHRDQSVPELIERAYAHDNAAARLLVKGSVDMFASGEKIHWRIDSPGCEVMEAMGGTGDTITGMASALIASGMDMEKACHMAALANRHAGMLTRPTPATQVAEIVRAIPQALAGL
ncbi:carbohydrate kinase [Desulfobotulus alkaliphilus]|uniref:Carbohydrate kinase n=1 Tax=Desulfobotulus alkaliphilus TaxID=622671 RepID=A0A562S4K3_9BACT|nr:NAD(P)H-hydrate dehydratase [Desulfobotulus alkaliphilus]TWI75610.1 carbohydrate kinase [Desulfobotulus alkaliphilus]